MSDTQLFQIKITATGEVRDAEGNLLNSEPVEAVATVTAEQAQAILERSQA